MSIKFENGDRAQIDYNFFDDPSPSSQQTTARPVTPPSAPSKEQKLLDIITSKRIAAVFSIILCITLYFGLLENVFTKKVDTLIVYTQEGSEYIHGEIDCHINYGTQAQPEYHRNILNPDTQTTLYECPDKLLCCMGDAKETTITEKDYITPFLISLSISAFTFVILTFKKKAQ